jgi:hypothetical protein|tara:strand:- start:260 stop:766 length:507 start_codon:yes stop_codon:yes gene_type:complete
MSAVEFEIDFKRLQRKLAGLEKYAPRNAMKAAAGAAFKVVNKENARRVATASYKTPMEPPAFRKRAAKKGGYRLRKVKQRRDGSITARSDYNTKHPEMEAAWFVERGYNTKNGRVAGRHFRGEAFKAKKREAQALFLEALSVAIDVASSNPKGKVSMRDVEGVIGKAW